MVNTNNSVKIGGIRDRFGFLSHTTALCGVLAAVSAVTAVPVVSGLALYLTLRDVLDSPKELDQFERALPPEEIDYSQTEGYVSGRLRKRSRKLRPMFNRISGFSKMAGLKQTPALHVLRAPVPEVLIKDDPAFADLIREVKALDTSSESKEEEAKLIDIQKRIGLRGSLMLTFGERANAFAFKNKRNHITLTEKLMKYKDLNPREVDAILAHEIAHLAAGHSKKSRVLSHVAKLANWTARINEYLIYLASVKNAGIALFSYTVARMSADSYALSKGLDLKQNPAHILEYQKRKDNTRDYLMAGIGLVLMAPELTIAVGIKRITAYATKWITSSDSRAHEFQADRIAARLTNDPEAMSSALGKLKEHFMLTNPVQPSARVNDDIGKDTPDDWKSRLEDWINDMGHSHPSFKRRQARLATMTPR